jgi:hypothetical protein
MGYRSDVTYIVTFNCVDQPEKAYAQFIHFYEWVTKHHKIEAESGHYDYKRHRSLGYGKFYWNVDEMTLVFEAEDIKYYDSYIDTQWDEQLLKEVEKYSCGVYKFVRLGEDPADVEYKTTRVTTLMNVSASTFTPRLASSVTYPMRKTLRRKTS